MENTKRLFDPLMTITKSRRIALNRFQMLNQRFQRQPELYKRYQEVMNEYFELGEVTPATTPEEQLCSQRRETGVDCRSCTLPYHSVFKEDSVTTKVRVA